MHDSFGDTWELAPPQDEWSLFRVDGLDVRSLVSWSAVTTPLQGPALDEVVLGVDEDANLLWAVERRVAGREVPTPANPPPPPPPTVAADEQRSYDYSPSSTALPGWHPYLAADVQGRRRYVQARLADLSGPVPVLAPEPRSDLLEAGSNASGLHEIEPAAVPTDGLRVERRAMLVRRTDGTPVLWTQRRAQPLLTPPALGLRWDQLVSTGGTA